MMETNNLLIMELKSKIFSLRLFRGPHRGKNYITIKVFSIICFIILVALVVLTIKAYRGNERKVKMWREISELEKKYDILISDKFADKLAELQ